jgi:hypothetical protein
MGQNYGFGSYGAGNYGPLFGDPNAHTYSWGPYGAGGYGPSYGGAADYATRIVADGPSLYWRLGLTNGLTDLSGNGRDGTAAGGASAGNYLGALAGDANEATDLDGADDSFTCSYTPFVDGVVRSFEGWANRDGTNRDALFGSSTAQGPFLEILSGGSNVKFSVDWDSNTVTWIGAWPGTAQWVHWVLVFDEPGNVAELYINGVSKGTKAMAASWSHPASTLWLARWTGGLASFDGKMDEFAVYEYGLTATQVAAHYAAGLDLRGHPGRRARGPAALPTPAVYA